MKIPTTEQIQVSLEQFITINSMGKIIETVVKSFNGGIINDPRTNRENVAKIITNFDVLTDIYRAIPYRNSESGDTAPTTSKKQNFCIALRTGTTYSLYALGVVSGTARAEILYKDITTGGSNDLGDSGWATPTANQSASGTTDFNLFVYYKKRNLIFGGKASQYIWAFSPSGSAFSETERDLTSYTNLAQGLVHSKDDILYIPYDNKIAKLDDSTWTNTALTLPSHLFIRSIWEDGNNLMIACAPLSGVGESIIYVWDRDSSLTTLSETIKSGTEKLLIADKTDGVNISISLSGSNSTRNNDRVIFRYLNGNIPIKFAELVGGSNSTLLPIAKQVINNRLYFMMSITLNGSVRNGVWSVGRDYVNGGFSIIHERTPNNDTALSTPILYSFFFVGDYLFQSYNSSSAFALSKTNDSEAYTDSTSIIETKIYNNGDSSYTKELRTATVMFEPLPANGQVVLKYKIDAETSFTTLYTYSTDNGISHGTGNIESSSTNLSQYKEIQFRIESVGGAVITGFKFKSEIIKDNDNG